MELVDNGEIGRRQFVLVFADALQVLRDYISNSRFSL